MKNIRLIIFSWVMLAALITMCLILGCTKQAYPYEPTDYQYISDPSTSSYKVGTWHEGALFTEPFVQDTICSHLFVRTALECEEPDSSISIILNQIGIEQGFTCACLYCHKISKCY